MGKQWRLTLSRRLARRLGMAPGEVMIALELVDDEAKGGHKADARRLLLDLFGDALYLAPYHVVCVQHAP